MRLSSRPAWMLTLLLLGSNLFAAEPVAWETNLERAQQMAAQSNRLVLVHFWTSWCGWCKWMDAEVFAKPEVAQQIQANYVPVKIDADQHPELAKRFGIDRLPTDVILTPQGQVVNLARGKSDAVQYVTRLSHGVALARQRSAGVAASIPPAASMVNTNPPAVNPPANNQPINNQPLAAMPTPPAAPNPTPSQPPIPGLAAGPSFSLNGPVNAAPPLANTLSPQVARPATMPNPGLVNNPALANNPPAANANTNNVAAAMQSPPVASRMMMASGVPPMTPPAAGQPMNVPPGGTAQPPQSNMPIALDGFCPVSLVKKWQWVPGDKRWGAYHQGRTYLFAGPEEQSQFLANGNYDHYAPVASGNDVVLAVEERKTVPGRREYGILCSGRIFLFSSAETRQKFEANSNFYVGQIQGVPHQAASPSQQQPR